VVLFAAAASFTIYQAIRSPDQDSWARHEGIPEIIRLARQEDYMGALSLAEKVERLIPKDPELIELWEEISVVRSIESSPEGADVYMKGYRDIDGEWKHVGRTPISDLRIPRGLKRWRIAKEGFATLDVTRADYNEKVDRYTLMKLGTIPPEMVHVQGWTSRYSMAGLNHLEPVLLEDFLIDRCEVTNRQFKEFMDNGGYQYREHWKQPFIREGRVLTWQEAIKEFVDKTGKSGPSTWHEGNYPPGQGEYPVSGVSWYEAAAYAEYAQKSLPTVIHWIHASSPWFSPQMVPLSNFGADASLPVGTTFGISHFGAYDMTGNVKEWCWNASGRNRYLLGGAFNQVPSTVCDPEIQSPFTRLPTYGFRCAKYLSQVSEAATGPLQFSHRDFDVEKPVSDTDFEIFQRFYSYDKSALTASVDSIDESADYWIKETVSFNAAYANGRVSGYLLLPKRGEPPYQTIVYFPPSNAFYSNSSQKLEFEDVEFLVESGRAVFYPVYKGTYERKDELESDMPALTKEYRDHVIMWSKDLGRSIDYLESRPDIDGQKLAFYGYSAGAALGAILTAVEDRLKASVLYTGGFHHQKTFPEVDQLNFAPRVTVPTLMINGRYDFSFPVESSQESMFRTLGTPEEYKRHITFESGHTVPRNDLIRETLAWLDLYLGPVETG
jgi:dienelactone hydrolase